MVRKALIRKSDGYVENVIVADSKFKAPTGYQLRTSDKARKGDTWNGTVFIPGPVPTPSPQQEARGRAITAIKANKDTPWGRVLYDLAIADGSIEDVG